MSKRSVLVLDIPNYIIITTHLDNDFKKNIEHASRLNKIVKYEIINNPDKMVILCGDMNNYYTEIDGIKNLVKEDSITFIDIINKSRALDFVGSSSRGMNLIPFPKFFIHESYKDIDDIKYLLDQALYQNTEKETKNIFFNAKYNEIVNDIISDSGEEVDKPTKDKLIVLCEKNSSKKVKSSEIKSLIKTLDKKLYEPIIKSCTIDILNKLWEDEPYESKQIYFETVLKSNGYNISDVFDYRLMLNGLPSDHTPVAFNNENIRVLSWNILAFIEGYFLRHNEKSKEEGLNLDIRGSQILHNIFPEGNPYDFILLQEVDTIKHKKYADKSIYDMIVNEGKLNGYYHIFTYHSDPDQSGRKDGLMILCKIDKLNMDDRTTVLKQRVYNLFRLDIDPTEEIIYDTQKVMEAIHAKEISELEKKQLLETEQEVRRQSELLLPDSFKLKIDDLIKVGTTLNYANISYWHNKVSKKGINIKMLPNILIKDGSVILLLNDININIISNENKTVSENTKSEIDRYINKKVEDIEYVKNIIEALILLINSAIQIQESVALFKTIKRIFDDNKLLQEKGIELRVAGGWIRDLLLNIPSDDVDFAITNMTGNEFVAVLKEYGIIEKQITIEQDTSKSKNLEVQTADIIVDDGFIVKSVDFVGLRKEVYEEASRIPKIVPGTVDDDAKRRDLTINSLYYNIHTDEIEDYTGGIHDFDKKILKPRGTEYDYYTIYKDDPLRIIRLARFAAKLDSYGFKIDPTVMKLIQTDNELSNSFRKKISSSRIVPELKKSAKYGPVNALIMYKKISDMKYWDHILKVPNIIFDCDKSLIPLNINELYRHIIEIRDNDNLHIKNDNKIKIIKNVLEDSHGNMIKNYPMYQNIININVEITDDKIHENLYIIWDENFKNMLYLDKSEIDIITQLYNNVNNYLCQIIGALEKSILTYGEANNCLIINEKLDKLVSINEKYNNYYDIIIVISLPIVDNIKNLLESKSKDIQEHDNYIKYLDNYLKKVWLFDNALTSRLINNFIFYINYLDYLKFIKEEDNKKIKESFHNIIFTMNAGYKEVAKSKVAKPKEVAKPRMAGVKPRAVAKPTFKEYMIEYINNPKSGGAKQDTVKLTEIIVNPMIDIIQDNIEELYFKDDGVIDVDVKRYCDNFLHISDVVKHCEGEPFIKNTFTSQIYKITLNYHYLRSFYAKIIDMLVIIVYEAIFEPYDESIRDKKIKTVFEKLKKDAIIKPKIDKYEAEELHEYDIIKRLIFDQDGIFIALNQYIDQIKQSSEKIKGLFDDDNVHISFQIIHQLFTKLLKKKKTV